MSNIKTFLDGDSWCAVFDDFINLQESIAGFGITPEEATESLLKATLEKANEILQDIKPEQEYAEDLIAKVKGAVLDSKTNFACDVAEVSYRKASQRISYDTKGLEKQVKEYPWLEHFRKVSEVKETTALKWL